MTESSSIAEDHGALQLPLEVIKRLAINDSGFIFDPVTGQSFTTNASGLLVLRLCRVDQNVRRIAEALTAEFDIDLAECEREVVEFASALRRLGT